MRVRFAGRFKPRGFSEELRIDAAADTMRPHQPSCVGVVQLNHALLEALPPGSAGTISGDTADKQRVSLGGVTLVRHDRRPDGSHEVQFEFESLELANESVLGLLQWEEAAFRVRWSLSGEPRLNSWISATEGVAAASALKEVLTLRAHLKFGVRETAVRAEWDADGLRRTEVRAEPFVEAQWNPGELALDDIDAEIVRIENEALHHGLLCIGFSLDSPIVVWQREEHVVLVKGSYGKDQERLIRCRQYLGKTPLFKPASVDHVEGDLTGSVTADRLQALAQDQGYLEPALQSLLWAAALPPATEFITLCTALEALKEWYLATSGLTSNFTTNSAQKTAEKRVREILRELRDADRLAVPYETVKIKAAELKRPPFDWAMEQLVLHLGVTEAELGGDLDLGFIGTRNRLVHTAAIPPQDELLAATHSARSLCRAVLERVLSGCEVPSVPSATGSAASSETSEDRSDG